MARFAVPLAALVVLALGLTEAGRVVAQAEAIHGGLQAGAQYAARNAYPLTPEVMLQVENIVKTGDPGGGAGYLAAGWARSGASVQVQELSVDVAGSPWPVVRISATVPYVPILTRLVPIPAFNIQLSREQPFAAD